MYCSWLSVKPGFQVLSVCCVQLALKMFHDVGLLQTFRVPIQKFIGFFHATEITYGSNPCTLLCTSQQTISLRLTLIHNKTLACRCGRPVSVR